MFYSTILGSSAKCIALAIASYKCLITTAVIVSDFSLSGAFSAAPATGDRSTQQLRRPFLVKFCLLQAVYSNSRSC
jgi:hypothetical protein